MSTIAAQSIQLPMVEGKARLQSHKERFSAARFDRKLNKRAEPQRQMRGTININHGMQRSTNRLFQTCL